MFLAVAAAQPPAVTFHSDANVSGAHITLSDVADLSRLPESVRARAAGLPLAAFGAGQSHLVVDARDLAVRAAMLMPDLGPIVAGTPEAPVTVRRTDSLATAGSAPCVRLTRQVQAGDFFTSSDFEPAACLSSGPVWRAARYDPHSRTVRTARALNAGDRIAAVPRSLVAEVTAGQKLYIKTRVGPVTVQRLVEAAQSSRPGQPLFVKADDGQVFSVPGPEATP